MGKPGIPYRPIAMGPIRRPANARGLYDEHLSMTAEQASKLAAGLHQMGQDELACEIDEAVGRAKHYEAM